MTDPNGLGSGSTNVLAQMLTPFPYQPVAAPHSYSSNEFGASAICSLSFLGRTWRFRTNPNQITWSYTLNTHVDQTYGGRVVQLLSTKIDDLIVKVDCGNGGWSYNVGLVLFLRDLLVAQRDPLGAPAVFEYTARNWKFSVYALNIPFQDHLQATVRELELHFKIQEDVSGVVSGAILSTTLAALQEGVGWTRNVYNSGSMYGTGTKAGTQLGGLGGNAFQNPQSGPVGPGQVGSTIGGGGAPAQITQQINGFSVNNQTQQTISVAKSWSPGTSSITNPGLTPPGLTSFPDAP